MAQQFDPAIVAAMARQMAQNGNVNPAQGASSSGGKSPFEQQLMALAMADKVKPDTSLGFLLGQILSGGLNAWAENYADRGDRKAQEAQATAQPNTAGINTDATNRLANNAIQGLLGGGNSALAQAAQKPWEDNRWQNLLRR